MKPLKPGFLLLVSILILALFFLPACGRSKQANDPTPNPTPAPASTPASAPAPDKNPPVDNKDTVIELIAKGSQIKEMSYNMVMIGPGLSSESKVWLKGKKMKTDTLMNGQQIGRASCRARV